MQLLCIPGQDFTQTATRETSADHAHHPNSDLCLSKCQLVYAIMT